MPIVIKEVIVKTIVERLTPQRDSLLDVQMVEKVKYEVLQRLSEMEPIPKNRRNRKDR